MIDNSARHKMFLKGYYNRNPVFPLHSTIAGVSALSGIPKFRNAMLQPATNLGA